MASTVLVPCVGLLEGVGSATVVAAAGACAERVPTSVSTAKPDAKPSSGASKVHLRPGQRSTVATDAETRANSAKEQQGRPSSYGARVGKTRKTRRR